MCTVVNSNYSSGTFNNVTGNQTNYNQDFTGAIVVFNSRRASTQILPPVLDTIPNEHYRDIVSNIFAICQLLHGFMNQPFSPGYLLEAIEKELKKFAAVVAYVARALDIIDKIPGKLKYLQHFKDVALLIKRYNYRLHRLYQDIYTYKTQLDISTTPGFWRGLWLYIFSRHQWGRLSAEIKEFLEENQETLESFLHFLTSRSWRKIFPDEQGQALERLILEAGLQPDPGLRHLQMLKILVRDHLGRILPIPMEFCMSWMDFEIVIKHCCRDIEGGHYVQRDEWEVVRAADNTVIDRSHFMSIIEPEMELDISIVLWMLVSSLFVCPGCGHDNPRRETKDGWINCYNCDKYFRIVANTSRNRSDSGGAHPERHPDHGLNERKQNKQHMSSILKPIRELAERRTAVSGRNEGSIPTDHEQDVAVHTPDIPKPPDTNQPVTTSNFLRVSVQVQKIIPRTTDSSTEQLPTKVNEVGDERSTIRPKVTCSHCQQEIVDTYFRCTLCESVDICSNCELVGLPGNLDSPDGGHSAAHNMIKTPYSPKSHDAQRLPSEEERLQNGGMSSELPQSLSLAASPPPEQVTDCSACGIQLDTIRYVCATCGPKQSIDVDTPRRGPQRGPGYELCSSCLQIHGVMHSIERAIIPSPHPGDQNLGLRQLRHAFQEKLWGDNGWDDVENDKSRTSECAFCNATLRKHYTCAYCEDLDVCLACYSQIHELHPRHPFLVVPEMSPEHIQTTPPDAIDEGSMKHTSIKCLHCLQDIVGPRFHCLSCESVDVCSHCEAAGFDLSSGGHTSEHMMIKIPYPTKSSEIQIARQRAIDLWQHEDSANATHSVLRAGQGSATSSEDKMVGSSSRYLRTSPNDHGMTCSGCDKPIIGARYQCATCPSKPAPYNLCAHCDERSWHVHNPYHIFLKLPRPVDRPLESAQPILPLIYQAPVAAGYQSLNKPEGYLRAVNHITAVCDRCMTRIRGKWYHCAYCGGDLCGECEQYGAHNETHIFMVFKAPVDMVRFRAAFPNLDNLEGSPSIIPHAIYAKQAV